MYLIVETATRQEYEPAYDSRDAGNYKTVKTEKVHRFINENEIIDWIEKNTTASYKAYAVKPLSVSRKVSISLLDE